jgi:hypothetical protein
LFPTDLPIGLVWESYANRANEGEEAGKQDAKNALIQANSLGFPNSLPIYFAVDWDARTATKLNNVSAYFDGIRSVLDSRGIGAYGGYYVIKTLFDNSKISHGWQTIAWSDGKWDSRAQIRHIVSNYSLPKGKGKVDFDDIMTDDWGGWKP